MMYECYIAFSIHGTNCFITANKRVTADELIDMTCDGTFTKKASRRPFAPKEKATKLEWCRLLNKSTGQPLKSPPVIVARFKELEALGWAVDKSKFVEKHFRGKHTRSVPR